MSNGPDMRRLLWGVGLMSVGAFLLLDRFGQLPEWAAGLQWWGGIVILLGILAIVTARRAESVGTGVTFILLGVWFQLVTNHLFGLRWYNSWPLALVAAGAGTVAHSIAAHWLPDTRRPRGRRWRERMEEPVEETHA